jgi:multisubunit Na+/H+ antiporter MnhC subunit
MRIVTVLGFLLIALGLWGMLTRKNLFRLILGFSIMDTGIHLIIVSLGFIKGRTAPIFDSDLSAAGAAGKIIDPIPSALVLTAIVIGLAVTALMLVYAVRMYAERKSLDISDYEELKW